jgi:aryl-alcohol dehydrogenase-like predicted oxidoreductase
MEMRKFGNTDMVISRLGVGMSEIGFVLTLAEDKQASAVLNSALDAGVNFLDTSACYDVSEEQLGRAVSHRRRDYYLATKAGHVAGGYEGEEWTAQTITDSIDRSLHRMKTDYIDLLQLHTCGVDVLEKGEALQAVQDAKQAGKVRYIGYSGDNEAAAWAVDSGQFDSLQTSFNLVEQKARYGLLQAAKAQGMGVIIKRPIGNGAWGAPKSPSDYADQYWERAQVLEQMGPIPGSPDNRILLALGFTLAHSEIDTAIVGTQNPAHMQANLRWVEEELPIATEAVAELHRRYDEVGREWVQLS